jgi:hypothetical protein
MTHQTVRTIHTLHRTSKFCRCFAAPPAAARFLLVKTTPPRPYAPKGPAATVTAQAGITKPVKIFLELNV